MHFQWAFLRKAIIILQYICNLRIYMGFCFLTRSLTAGNIFKTCIVIIIMSLWCVGKLIFYIYIYITFNAYLRVVGVKKRREIDYIHFRSS